MRKFGAAALESKLYASVAWIIELLSAIALKLSLKSNDLLALSQPSDERDVEETGVVPVLSKLYAAG